ncbi:hypothetical protein D8B26_006492 [Coccidioides posadasii str. Silveira]|uniref:Uncharacterized protein n=1 Tax=Coccidioides posadasii (strain RMSCC 757 / Silveira) TaxID=443226 RepID=E9CTE3_COCPS|nr:conserved hypothetical protein [Coccidioides posadasii str. Silveira]QVM11849.1 hypothetical protein D8B26_006492 [Coccidioides posadasii str. Silveira]
MSTPTPSTPKGPRNTKKHSKRIATPISHSNTLTNGLSSVVGKGTPPYFSPSAQHNDSNSAYDSSNTLSEGGSRSKKARPTKKHWDPSKPSNGSGNTGHRHTSSQPSVKSPLALRGSPHYAGPTFHASPAPSALPVPSFVSKSVPEADSPLQTQKVHDSDDGDSSPTQARTLPLLQEEDKNTSSPLEFLFRAAREANNVNGTKERGRTSGSTTPLQEDVKKFEIPQESEPVSGAVFPLEMDASESRVKTPDSKMMAIGPSFAPSYRERINALRSASSPSSPADTTTLNEEERKAKAEALKNLLLNPTPQRSASSSLGPRHNSGLFSPQSTTARPNHCRISQQPSSMTTPVSSEQNTAKVNAGDKSSSIPYQYLTSVCNGAHKFPNPSSNTQKEMFPVNQHNPTFQMSRNHSAHTYSGHSTFHGNYVSPTPNRTVPSLVSGGQPAQGVSTRLDPLETKRMEDDLRRILKLNVNDTHNVKGMRQTMA